MLTDDRTISPYLKVTNLTVEHWNPTDRFIGVGTDSPRLSWCIEANGQNESVTQQAAVIEITDDKGLTQQFVIEGQCHTFVKWPGRRLVSRDVAYVRVSVYDGTSWSVWSDWVVVEAGLFCSSDWVASFIAPVGIGGWGESAPRLFRSFAVPAVVSRARLYVTAHGLYRVMVNGCEVTDSVLNPGWTSYRHRLRYQCFDVTGVLRVGGNEIAVLLGDGWWRGHLKWGGGSAFYGDELAVCAQLEVELVDGRTMIVGTDPLWRACNSGVVRNSLYHGSMIDYRVDHFGSDGHTYAVRVVEQDMGQLVACDGPLMRRTGILTAKRIWRSPLGRLLVDFGQNAVGWVRLRVRGFESGHVVSVRHAEVLEDGELGIRPLRKAKAMDTYVLDGPAERVLEPVFTLHGFRYVQIDGLDMIDGDDIEFVVVGTDLRRVGWFDTSDVMLNRLFENVCWSTRSNFVDIPTDCPQRDERLGWTGDIQVFSPTALYVYDVSGLLVSWLKDVAVEQYADGGIPLVVPEPDAMQKDPTACAWGDAVIIVPWNIYLATGDVQVLERQMSSMKAWMDHVVMLAGSSRLWRGGFQFGDWLDPTAPADKPWQAKADPDVVATACFARCAMVLAQACRVVGDMGSADRYECLAREVRGAFRDAFVGADGRIQSDAQTVYAVAIHWGLLTVDQRQRAGERLAQLVDEAGYRIATGFIGTPIICDALSETGHVDVAWRLLNQRECPSWLYPITMGATTMWERWDSMLPDGRINPGEMTSFNHYALGSVADWMVRTIAGLSLSAPGWRSVLIRPQYCGCLDYASASHMSPYGLIETGWTREGTMVNVSATIPEGVDATVILPDGTTHTIGAGTHSWHTNMRSTQQQ